RIQQKLGVAQEAKARLENDAIPDLNRLRTRREDLLQALKYARDSRRAMRRDQTKILNKKTSGSVRLDIPNKSDVTLFRQGLDKLKIGSRLRESVLDRIANNMHPYNLVRALWSGDVSEAGKVPDGIEATDL